MKDINSVVFDFSGNEIENLIKYNIRLLERMGKSFDFIFEKLSVLGYHSDFTGQTDIDFNTVKVNEEKNYNWIATTHGNISLVVRQYRQHLTIFIKNTTECELKSGHKYTRENYGAITLVADIKKLSDDEHDAYLDETCDKPFIELNKIIGGLLSLISEGKMWLASNNAALPTPHYCRIKGIYSDENIDSVDSLIFAAEELSTLHRNLFAENEMFEKLKTMADRVGTEFGNGVIKRIKTEFPTNYSEPYYHAIGIEIEKKDGRTDFNDVYSLTSYYFNEVFK